jgi:RNA polymerase sigma-70 factor (ECF subfamily)
MNTLKLTDEEILQQYKDLGNVEYFGDLFKRYILLLYGVYLKYLQDADKAQESVIQLFENLLLNISRYDIKVFRTWIYSLAKNHCRLLLLQEENPEIIADFEENKVEPDEILQLLNEAGENDARMNVLRKGLKQLPVQQRIALIRFFIERMSYEDIVGSTGYNLTQVKTHIQEGRQNLKNCMKHNT